MKTLYFCAFFAMESEKETNVKMMDGILFTTDLRPKCAILSINFAFLWGCGKKVCGTKFLI